MEKQAAQARIQELRGILTENSRRYLYKGDCGNRVTVPFVLPNKASFLKNMFGKRFFVDGKEYIALIPDDDSDDVYIYGYNEVSEEEFELIDIEDDDEFDRVVKVFEELTDEE